MERKSIAFEQLSDIYGFRILVDTVADCYARGRRRPYDLAERAGRFKDYISTPKQNDYRSIHTTVIGPGSQRVELQIRTARHARDRRIRHRRPRALQGRARRRGRRAAESRAYRGLRQTIEALADGDNSEEFLEHTKLELFQDQVVLLHAQGAADRAAARRNARSISPTPSTPTSAIRRSGAKINGRIAPLISNLRNGDEVLIIALRRPGAAGRLGKPRRHRPARAAIRRATREAAKAQYGGLGRADRRARLRAGGQQVLRRQAEGGAGASRARLGRRRLHRRRARRTVFVRRGARHLSRLQGRAEARPGVAEGESGWFGLAKAANLVFRVPGKGEAAAPLPMRGVDCDTAGALRAEGRRGARRAHRRHSHAGRGHHHLSDPFAGADRLRRQAGIVARRALGPRRRAERRSTRPRSR